MLKTVKTTVKTISMAVTNRYEAEYYKSVYEASGKFDPDNLVSKYEEIEKDSHRVQKLKQKFS
jgi:7,8-dihydro-6-hydroxymethylpterin-pyrophosphokinase